MSPAPRAFRLTDAELAALAIGRPSAGTLAELRRAQLTRTLLLLSEIPTPLWYARKPAALDDPVAGLYAATAVTMMRSGERPPDRPTLVDPAARTLVTSCDGVPLRVRLEDADPLRDRFGLTPTGRLTSAEVAHWQRTLDDAWRLLVRRHPADAAIVAAVLKVIVPVEPDPAAGGISATSAHAFGAVAMSAPASGPALAVALIHETAHSLLNAATLLFDLVTSTERGYSPWRDDPRPPSGILHGAYAYLAVTRFHRAEAAAGGRLAAFEFTRWRAAVVAASGDLLDRDVLTAAGRRFVSALRDEANRWRDDPVEPEIARLATDVNTDHRVRWRLRNLRVDVTGLVEAWKAGRAAPMEWPVAAVLAGPRRLEASARLGRVHALLRDGSARSEPSQGDHRDRAGSGVRPGDDAWLGGDHGTGRNAYLKEISRLARVTAPGDRLTAALAGLALVTPSPALRERPEIVLAMWEALDRPALLPVVTWLDR